MVEPGLGAFRPILLLVSRGIHRGRAALIEHREPSARSFGVRQRLAKFSPEIAVASLNSSNGAGDGVGKFVNGDVLTGIRRAIAAVRITAQVQQIFLGATAIGHATETARTPVLECSFGD